MPAKQLVGQKTAQSTKAAVITLTGFLTNNFSKDLGIGDVLDLSDQEDEVPLAPDKREPGEG